MRKVVFVGTTKVTGEVDDSKLPADLDYLEPKLKYKHFTVLKLQTTQDQQIQDALKKIKEESRAHAGERQADLQMGPAGRLDLRHDEYVSVLPAAVLVLVAVFFFVLPRFRDPLGGGFLSNYIKSPAKRYERSRNRITFDDVAGLQNAKSELKEVVEFLRDPQKFQRLGAVVPKGVLLVGPPGTGKTLLAKAVAGEAGVPFFSISGSEFIQMFVGVGASRVRDMFKTAKENAPCILFIDEIDAVGRMRGAGVGGGSDEREQTLNQILSEMDGFTPTESVIVMAATNRPDVLDSALLRPGRFDRHITVDRPTWQGRQAILKVHTRNKPLADDVNLEEIARGMIGMTGRRPAQPGQRSGAGRHARGQEPHRPQRLRPRRRPRADGRQARGSADGRGEAAHRLPRGRPRPGELAAAGGRPAAQGHDHPARPRAGRDRSPARRGPPRLRPRLLEGAGWR